MKIKLIKQKTSFVKKNNKIDKPLVILTKIKKKIQIIPNVKRKVYQHILQPLK